MVQIGGVPLNNGNALYPNGDEVQTVEVWKPPELWADISVAELNQILDKIDAGLPDSSPATPLPRTPRIVRHGTSLPRSPRRPSRNSRRGK